MLDWAYDHLGLVTYSTELWSLGLHVASLFHDVLYDGEVAYALFVAGGLLAGLGLLHTQRPLRPAAELP